MKKSAFIYVILAGVLWGTSGIFFHLLEPYGFRPLQMTAMRGFVSAVGMSLYVLIWQRRRFRIRPKEALLFLCSGLSLFGTASCYFGAISASSVSTAVILMYTAPVFVTVFSVSFLGEKLNLPKVVSILCMIVGCALVSGIIGGMRFSVWGIVLGFGAGLSYSAYNIFTKIEMMHGCNSLSATLYCFIVMGTISTAVSDPVEVIQLTAQKPAVIVPLILGIGVCTCILPYVFYTLALKDIPAGTASALSIVEPMSATLFSVAFLDEKLSVPSACGIALIVAAVCILNRSGAERASKE